jgi:6-phospho-beta-glucosidase
MSKVALIGGGGARTPLLIHGLAREAAELGISELALYDIDGVAAELMAALGREIVRACGVELKVEATASIERAIDGARFVLSSIRVGGMQARARDERIIIEHGMVGQETTGPGGLAMALRTVPVALEHARMVERLAPEAWLINFTNPAGLITQALTGHSGARVIGICDTPSELFHRIAWSLGLPFEELAFDYAGLNHLGWVRRVLHNGVDITGRLLADDDALLRLYPTRLFEPEMIRALGLIPTEYLFFHYGRGRAYRNQCAAGASRGEEIARLNAGLFDRLRAAVEPTQAVEIYKRYLNQRNASYMKLEGEAGSALKDEVFDWDPFEGATGYHRIALEVMLALGGVEPKRVIVNVRNCGAIEGLADDDVVEVPAVMDCNGARPLAVGALPEAVRGLTLAAKAYERIAVRAAMEGSLEQARLALLTNPMVGEWALAVQVLDALAASDVKHLGYLR